MSSSSSDDDDMLLLALTLELENKTARKKRYKLLEFMQLTKELSYDDKTFQEFFFLNRTEFEEVLRLIGPYITKATTVLRKPVGPKERFGIYLRYLVTGCSFKTLSTDYNIGTATASKIINELSVTLWEILKGVVMPSPSKKRWLQIAAEFKQKYNIPNCLGVIGGRKIDSVFEKRCYLDISDKTRIALIGICDVHSRFITVDVSIYDAMDGVVFTKSELCKRIEDGTIKLPDPKTETNPYSEDSEVPYVFLGDEVFPLRQYLLRPFPRNKTNVDKSKLFNEKLEQVKEVVDTALQLVPTKFRALQKNLTMRPENICSMVRTCCVLYNYKLRHSTAKELASTCEGNLWKLKQLVKTGGNRGYASINVRDIFANYLMEHETQDRWKDGHFIDASAAKKMKL